MTDDLHNDELGDVLRNHAPAATDDYWASVDERLASIEQERIGSAFPHTDASVNRLTDMTPRTASSFLRNPRILLAAAALILIAGLAGFVALTQRADETVDVSVADQPADENRVDTDPLIEPETDAAPLPDVDTLSPLETASAIGLVNAIAEPTALNAVEAQPFGPGDFSSECSELMDRVPTMRDGVDAALFEFEGARLPGAFIRAFKFASAEAAMSFLDAEIDCLGVEPIADAETVSGIRAVAIERDDLTVPWYRFQLDVWVVNLEVWPVNGTAADAAAAELNPAILETLAALAAGSDTPSQDEAAGTDDRTSLADFVAEEPFGNPQLLPVIGLDGEAIDDRRPHAISRAALWPDQCGDPLTGYIAGLSTSNIRADETPFDLWAATHADPSAAAGFASTAQDAWNDCTSVFNAEDPINTIMPFEQSSDLLGDGSNIEGSVSVWSARASGQIIAVHYDLVRGRAWARIRIGTDHTAEIYSPAEMVDEIAPLLTALDTRLSKLGATPPG